MWDPPRPGLEPVSPALAGRLSTTAPPGKPRKYFLSFGYTPVLIKSDCLMLCLHRCPLCAKIWAGCFLYALLFNCIYQVPCEVNLPTPQIRKQNFREVKWLAQICTANGLWSRDLSSGLSDFKAQITLLHSAAFSFLFVSVKPLWGSRLHQLCLGQPPPKMGWVHALARVLESPIDGGGGVQRGQVEVTADIPFPTRRGFFLMLILENDELCMVL